MALQTQKFGTFDYGSLQPVSASTFLNAWTAPQFQRVKPIPGADLSRPNNRADLIQTDFGGQSAYTKFEGPNGETYYFVPEDYLAKGYVNKQEGKVYQPQKIFKPENIDYFLQNSEYVDLSNLKSNNADDHIGGDYGKFLQSIGQNPKGFLIKEDRPNPYQPSRVTEMLRPDAPITIEDKLVKQILGQGTTKYWTGQGHGSPEKNARAMASDLAAAGITDINDFGKTKQDTGLRGIAQVQLVDPNDPSKGGYAIPGYDQNGMPIGEPVALTPEQIATIKPSSTWDGEQTQTTYTVPVPVYNVHLGNKVTGAPIPSSYSRRGGDVWSGTFTGKDSTHFGVQFTPDGTPIFYTQKGGSTSSWGDILPVASFALNVMFPGAGAALGTAIGITNAAAAALVGNAIINGAMAEASGGDFWKGAGNSVVTGALASGIIPSTGSKIVDSAIRSGVGAAITGGDIQEAVTRGVVSATVSEVVPQTGNQAVDRAISGGLNAALTGGDVGRAVVSGAVSGAGAELRNAARSGSSTTASTSPTTSTGSGFDDVTIPSGGGGGMDGIDTNVITDADGTQFVYDQDNNLVDIIPAGTAPATTPPPVAETGVSTDTTIPIGQGVSQTPPAVTPPVTPPAAGTPPAIQEPETGVSTDTSGAGVGVTQPPATQQPETGISTDTSGAEPGAGQPPPQIDTKTVTEEDGTQLVYDLDGNLIDIIEPDRPATGVTTGQTQETGVSTDTSGAEPGANQPPADQGQETGVSTDTSGADEPTCADGYTWDATRQICVPNDDTAAESQECPTGYIYDLTTRTCVRVGSSTSGGRGGGGGGGAGAGASGGGGGGRSTIPTLAAAASSGAQIVQDEPMRRIGLPIYDKIENFEGPLSDFLDMVQKGSYIAKPNEPQPEQQTMNNPTQPDRLDAPQNAGGGYFNYGQESSIDTILNPGIEVLGFKEGGMASPLMAAGGTTRYGMNSGGALNVVHHSGKPRLDFREGAAVTGEGDGQSDDIPAMLADGEFVFPADVVAALGNGSTKAGSDKLYEMMHSIRAYHRSAKPEDLPPPAKKSPLDYLKKPARKARGQK